MTRGYCLCSALICSLLTAAFSSAADAQSVSTDYRGWRITINESPSQEFVAQALADLQALFPPYEPATDWSLCCLAIGNYGGAVEPSEADDGEVPFFRLTDDIEPFGVGLGAVSCDRGACVTGAFFSYHGTSASELMSYVANYLAMNSGRSLEVFETPSGELVPFVGWGFNKDEATSRFPVFVRPDFSTLIMSDVWAVSFSAVPEPATLILALLPLSLLALRWGRCRSAHRA
jgi:hypothetical protein